MDTLLDLATVLVLNRHWQAIAARTPADAFAQLMTGAACGLDIEAGGGGALVPVRTWAEWLLLPVRAHDRCARTVRGAVRVPTVVVLCRYGQVPRRRPALSARAIWARDGRRCQFTGKVLAPGEGHIDHVVGPRRGRGDLVGELCGGLPAGQQPQGRPHPRGGGPTPFARPGRPARAARQPALAQPPPRARLGTVPRPARVLATTSFPHRAARGGGKHVAFRPR